jgi:hypothetical protein
MDEHHLSLESLRVILLPIVMKEFVPADIPFVENEVIFNWDTSTVDPGEYFICASIDDNLNQAIYCSEAPMRVLAPE